MQYYIVAGEPSGDLHGSNLIRALKEKDAQADIRCWGGDMMEAVGGQLVKHYKDLAFMGFVEVAAHLNTIFKNISFCKKDIAAYQPDVLILIDYPGFNLRIAEWAHQKGIKVVYYISPQVWAWKESRVKKIRQTVDKMLVILPFEKAFYKKWNYEVEYVGHPLADVIEKAKKKGAGEQLSERKIIALLPGSRKQEIQKKLPIMLKMVQHFPDYDFVIAQAPNQPNQIYDNIISSFRETHIKRISGKTYKLLQQAEAALVTSGTATLETALFGVPQVVCYIGNPISYLVAKKLIKIKYISLVNLILDKEAVPELIQGDLNEKRLKSTLTAILKGEKRLQQLQNYQHLQEILKEGNASEKAATAILNLFLNK